PGGGRGADRAGLFQGNIRDNQAVEAGGLGAADESVVAGPVHPVDDRDAAHRDQADRELVPDGGDLVEDFQRSRAEGERLVQAGGEGGTVGDRIGKGDADRDDAGASALEGGEHGGGRGEGRIAAADEGHEGAAVLPAEGREDVVDAVAQGG